MTPAVETVIRRAAIAEPFGRVEDPDRSGHVVEIVERFAHPHEDEVRRADFEMIPEKKDLADDLGRRQVAEKPVAGRWRRTRNANLQPTWVERQSVARPPAGMRTDSMHGPSLEAEEVFLRSVLRPENDPRARAGRRRNVAASLSRSAAGRFVISSNRPTPFLIKPVEDLLRPEAGSPIVSSSALSSSRVRSLMSIIPGGEGRYVHVAPRRCHPLVSGSTPSARAGAMMIADQHPAPAEADDVPFPRLHDFPG